MSPARPHLPFQHLRACHKRALTATLLARRRLHSHLRSGISSFSPSDTRGSRSRPPQPPAGHFPFEAVSRPLLYLAYSHGHPLAKRRPAIALSASFATGGVIGRGCKVITRGLEFACSRGSFVGKLVQSFPKMVEGGVKTGCACSMAEYAARRVSQTRTAASVCFTLADRTLAGAQNVLWQIVLWREALRRAYHRGYTGINFNKIWGICQNRPWALAHAAAVLTDLLHPHPPVAASRIGLPEPRRPLRGSQTTEGNLPLQAVARRLLLFGEGNGHGERHRSLFVVLEQ